MGNEPTRGGGCCPLLALAGGGVWHTSHGIDAAADFGYFSHYSWGLDHTAGVKPKSSASLPVRKAILPSAKLSQEKNKPKL